MDTNEKTHENFKPPTTPGAFEHVQAIVEHVFREFGVEAERQIALLRSTDGVADFSAELNKILNSLGTFSKHCCDYTLEILIHWRKKRRQECQDAIVNAGLANGSQDQVFVVQQIYILSIDIVFCRTAAVLLGYNDGVWVCPSETLCDFLEDSALAFFKANPFESQKKNLREKIFKRGSHESSDRIAYTTKRRHLIDLWTCIWELLSNVRRSEITKKCFQYFTRKHCDSSAVIRMLKGLRGLRFDFSCQAGHDEATNIIGQLYILFEHQKILKVKHAICETLTFIIHPICDQHWASHLQTSAWYKLLGSIYEKTLLFAESTKNVLVAYPLCMAVLCVCEKEDFLTQLHKLLNGLFNFYKDRDTRTIALSCLHRILAIYLQKMAAGTQATTKHLLLITQRLLPDRTPEWQPTVEEQNGLIAIVLTAADYDVGFAIEHMIYPMWKQACLVSNRFVEIAFRSILALLYGCDCRIWINADQTEPLYVEKSKADEDLNEQIEPISPATKYSFSTQADPNAQYMDKPKQTPIQRTYQTIGPSMNSILKTVASQKVPMDCENLDIYKSELSDIVGRSIRSCIRIVGEYLSISQEKLHSDMENGNITTVLSVLRLAILCAQRLQPSGIHPQDFIRILCKCSIHQYEGVAVAAQHVIAYLMNERLELRPHICNSFAKYIMKLPDACDHEIGAMLKQMNEFLDIWTSNIAANGTKELGEWHELNVEHIEACAMFWMTSLSPSVRMEALDMLDSIRGLCDLFPDRGLHIPKVDGCVPENNSEEDVKANENLDQETNNSENTSSTSVRLIEVIEEMESEIIKRIVLRSASVFDRNECIPADQIDDSGAVFGTNGNDCTVLSIKSLLQRRDIRGQYEWTLCLAELLRHMTERTNGACEVAFEEISARIDHMLNILFVNTDGKSPNQSYIQAKKIYIPPNLIQLWRNYAVFACIAASTDAAEGIFHRLIPLLTYDINSEVTNIAVTAFGGVNRHSVETLLKNLGQFEDDSHEKRKIGKHLSDTTRIHVAHIYRRIAEVMDLGILQKHEMIRDKYLKFIQSTFSFLCQPGNELRWDLVELRLHFCVIIRRISEEWYKCGHAVPLNTSLRKGLFGTLQTWCGYGPLSATYSEKILKHKDMLLSRMKDPGNRIVFSESFDERLGEVEFNSLTAMAGILLGVCFDDTALDYRGSVLLWIKSVLRSADPMICVIATIVLDSIIRHNPGLLSSFLSECYSSEAVIARSYTTVLGEVWLRPERSVQISLPVILHLVIFKMGDRSQKVRSLALKMIPEIVRRFPPSNRDDCSINIAVSSRLPDSYHEAQEELSRRFASGYSDVAAEVVQEMAYRLRMVDSSHTLTVFKYIIPFVTEIHLDMNDSNSILEILVSITLEHHLHYATELEQIWTQIASNTANIECVLYFILQKGANGARDEFAAGFFETAKRITLFLSRKWRRTTIRLLVSRINDKSLQTLGQLDENYVIENLHYGNQVFHRGDNEHFLHKSDSPHRFLTSECTTYAAYAQSEGSLDVPEEPLTTTIIEEGPTENCHLQSHFSDRSSNSKRMRECTAGRKTIQALQLRRQKQFAHLTTSNYAMMLLVEVAYEMDSSDEHICNDIALLLHVGVLGLDHPLVIMREHCKRMLVHIIHAMSFKLTNSNQKNKIDQAAADLMEQRGEEKEVNADNAKENAVCLIQYMTSRRSELIWKKELISETTLEHQNREQLCRLIDWILCLIENGNQKDLSKFWGTHALHWATISGSKYLASRSYQVYRALCPHLDWNLEAEPVLKTLSNALATIEESCIIPEILVTLQEITQRLKIQTIVVFPELLWNCIELLQNSPQSHVYIHCVRLLTIILDRLPLKDPQVWRVLFKSAPTFNDVRFNGLQPLILKGLQHISTRQQSLLFLSQLTLFPSEKDSHELIDPSNGRLLMNVVAQIPNICFYVENYVSLSKTRIQICEYVQNSLSNIQKICLAYKRKDISDACQQLLDKIKKRNLIGECVLFLEDLRKPLNKWIADMDNDYDYQICELLVSLLDEGQPQYHHFVLTMMHGILLDVDWENSHLMTKGHSIFRRVSHLLSSVLWSDANLVLEVILNRVTQSENPVQMIEQKFFISNLSSVDEIRKEPQEMPWDAPKPEFMQPNFVDHLNENNGTSQKIPSRLLSSYSIPEFHKLHATISNPRKHVMINQGGGKEQEQKQAESGEDEEGEDKSKVHSKETCESQVSSELSTKSQHPNLIPTNACSPSLNVMPDTQGRHCEHEGLHASSISSSNESEQIEAGCALTTDNPEVQDSSATQTEEEEECAGTHTTALTNDNDVLGEKDKIDTSNLSLQLKGTHVEEERSIENLAHKIRVLGQEWKSEKSKLSVNSNRESKAPGFLRAMLKKSHLNKQ